VQPLICNTAASDDHVALTVSDLLDSRLPELTGDTDIHRKAKKSVSLEKSQVCMLNVSTVRLIQFNSFLFISIYTEGVSIKVTGIHIYQTCDSISGTLHDKFQLII